MSEKSDCTLLHLRFKLRVPPDILLDKSREAAAVIASVQGLIWKIWVVREEEFEIGGMYLFANRTSAEAYLNHPVILALRSNWAVVSAESQLWDIESSLSAVTRAPLGNFFLNDAETAALAAGGK